MELDRVATVLPRPASGGECETAVGRSETDFESAGAGIVCRNQLRPRLPPWSRQRAS